MSYRPKGPNMVAIAMYRRIGIADKFGCDHITAQWKLREVQRATREKDLIKEYEAKRKALGL